MLRFFAPLLPPGGDGPVRIVIRLTDWRKVTSRTAAVLTDLSTALAMPWDEMLRWYIEADAIYKETWDRRR
ncbi:conserved hypothetical protein [Agrobacterium genomosp. 2 str. CFBP 5494]|uniref:Uncharacterized protein n=1 Tax=Agrobacterium genomosp. 2 str. CFBP 5494 TaxID=1183436 RepID=A0A9W5F1M1_9HYPH|nr:conserved hypothetical protein [Agrobacterium genomosp. 2 str. CFBP 5494]